MYTQRRNEKQEIHSDILFFNRLNIALTTPHNYRQSIGNALAMTGNYYGNDRIHILKIHPDRTFTVPYEWHRKNIPSLLTPEKKQTCFYEKSLEKQLNAQNYIFIEDNQKLECQELKEHLRLCNTHHVVYFPLFSPYFFAFIAFSRCDCSIRPESEDLQWLCLLSDLFAAHLGKYMVLKKMARRLSELTKGDYRPSPFRHE